MKSGADSASDVSAATSEKLLPIEAAFHGEVDPSPGSILAQFDSVASLDSNRPPKGQVGFHLGASDGYPRIAQRLKLCSLQEQFNHGRSRRIVQQTIGPGSSVSIHGTADRNAEPSPAEAALILKSGAQPPIQNSQNFVRHDRTLTLPRENETNPISG